MHCSVCRHVRQPGRIRLHCERRGWSLQPARGWSLQPLSYNRLAEFATTESLDVWVMGMRREPEILVQGSQTQFGPGILWIVRKSAGSDKLIVCGRRMIRI
jgi:hypothetical protein